MSNIYIALKLYTAYWRDIHKIYSNSSLLCAVSALNNLFGPSLTEPESSKFGRSAPNSALCRELKTMHTVDKFKCHSRYNFKTWNGFLIF